MIGDNSDNLLVGTSGHDTISGLGGNDTLEGGAGADSLEGGDGHDLLFGEAGNDTLLGGLGDDVLSGSDGADRVYGEDGNDKLSGGSGADVLDGGLGSDTLRGEDDNDTLSGGMGSDELSGGNGNDQLTGGEGDDSVAGDGGDDEIFGEAGEDTAEGGAGDDTIFGGAGNDSLSAGVGADSLLGGLGNDTLRSGFGSDGIDTLEGGVGDDHLIGNAGDQLFLGGFGNDYIETNVTPILNVGVANTDHGIDEEPLPDVTPRQEDSFSAGIGDIVNPGYGADTIVGHAQDFALCQGADLHYDNIDLDGEGLTITIAANGTGTAISDNLMVNDSFSYVDHFVGSSGDDTFIATGADAFQSFLGLDGDDSIDGGAGYDQVDYDLELTFFNDIGTGITANLRAVGADGVQSLDGQSVAAGGYIQDTQGNMDFLSNIEWYRGTDLADQFYAEGTDQGLEVSGLDGDDIIHLGNGDDRVDGGFGDDDINTGDSDWVDIVWGSAGNDTITYDDTITGYHELTYVSLNTGITATIDGLLNAAEVDKGDLGSDTIIGVQNPLNAGISDGGFGFYGSSGDDTIRVTTDAASQWMQIGGLGGSDLIQIIGDVYIRLDYQYSESAISADLGSGNIIDGEGGHDTIEGQVWELRGTDYDDNIIGSSDNNSFIGTLGADNIGGGDGYDRLRYELSDLWAVDIDLTLQQIRSYETESTYKTGLIYSIEYIRGVDRGNDTLAGNDAANRFDGYGGDDHLFGRGGDDLLNGMQGNDHICGGTGDDTIYGGDGVDILSYQEASDAVEVYLNAGLSRGADGRDTFYEMENITGSMHDDRLVGDGADNVIIGGDGNDTIKGKDGNDSFDGEAGNDRITGGTGMDQMQGGSGNDTLFGLAGVDSLEGGTGDDRLYGGRDDDLLNGGSGADSLRGNLGNDTLSGGADNDDLRGGGSNDSLDGGAGDDFLLGENGRDTLQGGAGDDVLSGGAGGGIGDGFADVFVFTQAENGGGGFDRVRDFEDGLDRIDLSDYGFTDFTSEIANTASERGTALRLDLGDVEIIYIENFSLAQFDLSDVIL